jgi:transcriptional regulator with XRE-family HTH domain
MKELLFGELFKQKRMALGKTLRQFCIENSLDPGNLSKVERGLMPPPTSEDKLTHYAQCLGIEKGSDDWYEFFDSAHATAGKIPKDILSNEEVLSKLPLVFRTLRGQKLTREQLKKLAEEMKKV